MFGAIIRAVLVIVAGSLLFVALSMAGGEMVSAQEDVAPQSSQNPSYMQMVITWWPAVVLSTVVLILIGSAILRRGRVV